jgi:hypothetical protein
MRTNFDIYVLIDTYTKTLYVLFVKERTKLKLK